MADDGIVDTSTSEFARRLAAGLRVARERRKLTIEELAMRSAGAYPVPMLKALEAGKHSLRNLDLVPLARLYRVDLDVLLQPRMTVEVRPNGSVVAGGVSVGFDPADSDSLLISYLHLVRDLRSQRRDPVIALRREDVDSLAGYLRLDGSVVL